MKKIFTMVSILFIVITLSSCTGEEIVRLKINAVSTDDNNLIIKETSIDLLKDEKLAIWSEMDMKYKGDISLRFRLEILKDGVSKQMLEIDPTEKNLTIGEVKTDIMGDVKWSFTGKNTSINIKEDGNYTFKAFLVASKNNTLEINKAELVFKK